MNGGIGRDKTIESGQKTMEREINQPHHTAGEIKKSLIYIGNLSITKYYTKS